MPITVTVNGPIPGHIVPNQNQRDDAQDVIALLQYDDIWRTARTLRSAGVARLDMQGTIPANGGAAARQNLQVQIGNNTVAHADVSTSIQTGDAANQRGALRRVIGALNQSLNAQQSYVVAGTSP